MSSTYGENIKVTVFGQSHSPAIGVTVEGLPAGTAVDFEKLQAFLARRSPGRNEFSTARKEADEPEFLSGIVGNTTCGTPLTAVIRNTDTRSKDYSELKRIPRPGHADLTAEIKYRGFQDHAGGGHFSGRLTAPLCIAGGIVLQILEKEGIHVTARIVSVGGIRDDAAFDGKLQDPDFPTAGAEAAEKMKECIAAAKAEGDSVGGVIECVITGLPAGLGDPMFGGMENRIAAIVFGIPAIKGVEFGEGFQSAGLKGSENNDQYIIENGEIKTQTNHCGGILGGITNGMPLVFRAAVKPTPSVAKEQESVDLLEKKEKTLQIKGRHDPCIVPRAVPVIEAAAAIAVYDAILGRKKEF
ncbi:MAG: chorismate synthase [Lachnospiraceae bacterium]|nr:chorismate synthase [Lachnospiraceae bacterium]